MPCVYTQWVDAHRSLHLNAYEISEVSKGQKKRQANVFNFKIGQAMDFYLAGDSSPAIHSKTIAKVQKRIGICKKIEKFLANPNKIVDDLLLKQASYTHD